MNGEWSGFLAYETHLLIGLVHVGPTAVVQNWGWNQVVPLAAPTWRCWSKDANNLLQADEQAEWLPGCPEVRGSTTCER